MNNPGLSEVDVFGGGSRHRELYGDSGAVKIYVVRHGATAMNNDTDLSEDRIRGHRDVPLADSGREDARKAAEKLRNFGVQVIVSSDLSRAAETAKIISDLLGGVPVQVNPNLRPWNLGNLQGQSTKDAIPVIEQYVRQAPDTPVPGGESFHQFVAHANKGLAESIQLAAGRVLVVVTHHRDERLWRAEEATGWAPGQLDLNIFIQKGDPPGGVFEMNVNPSALSAIGGAAPAPPGAPAVSAVPGTPAGAPPMPVGAAPGAPPGGGLPVPVPGQPPGLPGAPGAPQAQPQPDPMLNMLMKMQQISKAIDLLRSDTPRGYRIDIEIDTMVAGDHEQERADATELLKAITEFVQAAGMIVPHLPMFAPLAAKMLQFGVRKFRTGRDLEQAIDEFADKVAKAPPGSFAPPQQPGKQGAAGAGPHDAAVAAAQVKTAQVKAQAEQARAVTDAKSSQENDQREAQLKQMEFQMKMREFQMRMAEMEREEQFKLAEHSRRMQQHAVSAINHQNMVANNGNGLSPGSPAGQ